MNKKGEKEQNKSIYMSLLQHKKRYRRYDDRDLYSPEYSTRWRSKQLLGERGSREKKCQ